MLCNEIVQLLIARSERRIRLGWVCTPSCEQRAGTLEHELRDHCTRPLTRPKMRAHFRTMIALIDLVPHSALLAPYLSKMIGTDRLDPTPEAALARARQALRDFLVAPFHKLATTLMQTNAKVLTRLTDRLTLRTMFREYAQQGMVNQCVEVCKYGAEGHERVITPEFLTSKHLSAIRKTDILSRCCVVSRGLDREFGVEVGKFLKKEGDEIPSMFIHGLRIPINHGRFMELCEFKEGIMYGCKNNTDVLIELHNSACEALWISQDEFDEIALSTRCDPEVYELVTDKYSDLEYPLYEMAKRKTDMPSTVYDELTRTMRIAPDKPCFHKYYLALNNFNCNFLTPMLECHEFDEVARRLGTTPKELRERIGKINRVIRRGKRAVARKRR